MSFEHEPGDERLDEQSGDTERDTSQEQAQDSAQIDPATVAGDDTLAIQRDPAFMPESDEPETLLDALTSDNLRFDARHVRGYLSVEVPAYGPLSSRVADAIRDAENQKREDDNYRWDARHVRGYLSIDVPVDTPLDDATRSAIRAAESQKREDDNLRWDARHLGGYLDISVPEDRPLDPSVATAIRNAENQKREDESLRHDGQTYGIPVPSGRLTDTQREQFAHQIQLAEAAEFSIDIDPASAGYIEPGSLEFRMAVLNGIQARLAAKRRKLEMQRDLSAQRELDSAYHESTDDQES